MLLFWANKCPLIPKFGKIWGLYSLNLYEIWGLGRFSTKRMSKGCHGMSLVAVMTFQRDDKDSDDFILNSINQP